jgi:hypothetical protein
MTILADAKISSSSKLAGISKFTCTFKGVSWPLDEDVSPVGSPLCRRICARSAKVIFSLSSIRRFNHLSFAYQLSFHGMRVGSFIVIISFLCRARASLRNILKGYPIPSYLFSSPWVFFRINVTNIANSRLVRVPTSCTQLLSRKCKKKK